MGFESRLQFILKGPIGMYKMSSDKNGALIRDSQLHHPFFYPQIIFKAHMVLEIGRAVAAGAVKNCAVQMLFLQSFPGFLLKIARVMGIQKIFAILPYQVKMAFLRRIVVGGQRFDRKIPCGNFFKIRNPAYFQIIINFIGS